MEDTCIKPNELEDIEPSTTSDNIESDIRLYYQEENFSRSDIYLSHAITSRGRMDIAESRRQLLKLLSTKSRRPVRKIKKKRKGPLRKRRPQKPRIQCKKNSSIYSAKVASVRSKSRCCVICGARCFCIRCNRDIRKHKVMRQKKYKTTGKPLSRGGIMKAVQRKQTLKSYRAKVIQVGSRSPMLSPLYITSSMKPPTQKNVEELKAYTMVTPQLIYEALRRLTMWRQEVTTTDILEYICRNYPINKELEELDQELRETLRIAYITGIVDMGENDSWCLKSSLQNLTTNHVTLFWTVYGDTLNPLARKKREEIDRD